MADGDHEEAQKPRRPRLDLPRTGLESALDIVAAAGVLLLFAMTALSWGSLPDTVPTHFDAGGDPDEWGSKESLLLLPLIAVVMWVGLTLVGRYPWWYNYLRPITEANAQRQYAMGRTFIVLLKAEMVWLFVAVQWMSVAAAGGQDVAWGAALTIGGVVVMLVSTAVYGVRSYRAG